MIATDCPIHGLFSSEVPQGSVRYHTYPFWKTGVRSCNEASVPVQDLTLSAKRLVEIGHRCALCAEGFVSRNLRSQQVALSIDDLELVC